MSEIKVTDPNFGPKFQQSSRCVPQFLTDIKKRHNRFSNNDSVI